MSQGLSTIVPSLSLDDEVRDVDAMIQDPNRSSHRSVSPDNISELSVDSSFMECGEVHEKGRMDVRVRKSLTRRMNSMAGSSMPAYEMKRLPRGLAVIIDIEIYENDIQERRFGSHVDVENLVQLLQGLSFDVTVHKNLHQGLFYKVITEFCQNKIHEESDMTVVVILSHGKDGLVYAADGQSIDMEYIYEFFNNRNCPYLQGKPKFFIVQACRGDRPDQGVEGDVDRPNAKRKRAEGLDRIPNLQENKTVARARPTWEDMIIAYSTIPGYASLRDHDMGTWFVQSLVEVFMNHSHDTELVDLLRMTSERLSHFTNEQGEKQTCNVEMRHLYKRIYFNPGLGPPPALSRSVSTPQQSSSPAEPSRRN